MQLHRIVVEWAGPQIVGRAVTVLHYDGTEDPSPPVAAIKSAFDGVAAAIPGGCTITTPGSGETIDDTTGTLTGVWSAAGGGITTCTGAATAAAGVGACITWNTGGIVNGRKLRGRTFVVPLTSTAYDGTGTITVPALGTVQTFADALMGSGGLAVWHRPTIAGGADGTSYGVLSNRVRDKVAYLSSRRD